MKTMVWGCGLVLSFAMMPVLPVFRHLRLEYATLKRGFVAWADETDRRSYP